MTTTLPPSALLDTATTVRLRPHLEGSNICTWIGFKHVNYLVEEAVLEHFRSTGLPAQALYEDHGLCLEVVGLDTRIGKAFHIDDAVTAKVTATREDGELGCAVTLTAERAGAAVRAATSKVRVVLRPDRRHGTGGGVPELAWFTTPHIHRPVAANRPDPSTPDPLVAGPRSDPRAQGGHHQDPVLDALVGDRNAFAWRWRIPYFYCHFSERLRMSGYLRQLEEAVDLFLASRSVSIRTLLDEQRWIPVVPHSAVTILDEALMEEDLYTVLTVEEIFKDVTYTARMDCYVLRDGALLPTATGVITHGYAAIRNRRDWGLVNFDDRLLAALRGDPAT